jgi:hypothetical protein
MNKVTMILATLCYVKRDGYTLMVYRNKLHETIKMYGQKIEI